MGIAYSSALVMHTNGRANGKMMMNRPIRKGNETFCATFAKVIKKLLSAPLTAHEWCLFEEKLHKTKLEHV